MKILEGSFCGEGCCDYPDPMISTGDVFVYGGWEMSAMKNSVSTIWERRIVIGTYENNSIY